jgi:hypothetical protein
MQQCNECCEVRSKVARWYLRRTLRPHGLEAVGTGDGRELVFGDGRFNRREFPDLLTEDRTGDGQRGG